MKWKISGATAAAVTFLTATLVAAPAAHAAGPSYVALGDSYASGTGTRSYVDDGTSCQRSTYAYASLIAAARGYSLNLRACSGAKIPDVTNNQLSALTTTTKYVSISIGGNDAGFADVLTECAMPGWMSDCNGAIDGAQAYINNTLPAKLSTLYASIRAKSPTAKVVVVGYPRIFNGEDCNALTWFSPAEETRLNATADLLNSRTATQASAKGFSFANPTSRFIGHAVCDDPEYLNGLSNPISESYHPNKAGHASGYAPVVSPLLTGASLKVDAATLAAAAGSADELAERQRAYAAADSTIEPEVFRLPDLDSPRARAAARRAGIDIDRWVARHAHR
ncbi:SGNH/GDSL hydrolase family protein [Nocardioides jensenii]|uniref:SGNH/GDSL hydrolase family protein n=1 Tax=Nocardioides jensenii TaxID=1843 RepID=UPI0008368AEC|nr:SGNH/GDSL hydrolase family protein [Nocardioides jensenii]